MGLFSKAPQRITLYSSEQSDLETFVSLLKAENLKDAKPSKVIHGDDEWQCTIHCKLAEDIYYEQVLPLLYSSVETQSFRILLELDDKSEPARRCPRELVVSFELKSKYAFGDKTDVHFIQKLHSDIVQGAYGDSATVGYYIVGGGSVTMSIPCLELSKMEKHIKDELSNYGIKKSMLQIVDRQAA